MQYKLPGTLELSDALLIMLLMEEGQALGPLNNMGHGLGITGLGLPLHINSR